ncbi:MAG TPA: ATP-grasp domain-containing protein [Planctomycetaceae bacterium]|nr:ATP-grasp domain-containing protein [Planctomycetaceae bacterium]
MTTILMSSRHTEDDQALWRAAIGRRWSVARARGIRLPEIDDNEVVIYVEALYAPTIAGMIGRRLLDPPEDWLVRLQQLFCQREVMLTTLGQARNLDRPRFVKPPNDKSFAAQVYNSGASLPLEFDDDMAVLVAEPVQWECEFRCFCLDGSVVTLSPYLRSGTLAKETDYEATGDELSEATDFAEKVLASTQSFTPRAVVIDVGQIAGTGWAVVEANAAWGSGIYGCDPSLVLDMIRHATIQPEHKEPDDGYFPR